jgi:hypothetical protein
MTGAPLSRWTMSYFAAAMLALLLSLSALASGFGVPATPAMPEPDTLVVVHLFAVGWLGLLIAGALLQFLPVLTGRLPRLPTLALPALSLVLSGLALLVGGFLALGGRLDVGEWALPAGGALLTCGLAALAAGFGATLLSRAPRGMAETLVLAGLVAMIGTAVLGVGLALLLSGSLDLAPLAAVLSLAVPYHAASGLLGFMSLIAIGVSYKLFPMFLLAPEMTGSGRRGAVLCTTTLAALYAALLTEAREEPLPSAVQGLALAAAMALVLFYAGDVVRMVKSRRRKRLEINSLAGLAALPFLVAGLGLLGAGAALDCDWPLAPTGFYLIAMGWLTGLGLAQIFKIVPFLTWLEAYGPVMGRSAVPRVQDLVSERRGAAAFLIFYPMVILGAAGLLGGSSLAFQSASLGQLVSVIVLAIELIRARRLSAVPSDLRLPAGACRPAFFTARRRQGVDAP